MIETIVINKREYPANYGISTLVKLARKRGQQLNDIIDSLAAADQLTSIELIVDVAQIALTEGARIRNTGETFSDDFVLDAINDDISLMSQVAEQLAASLRHASAFPTGTPRAETRSKTGSRRRRRR